MKENKLAAKPKVKEVLERAVRIAQVKREEDPKAQKIKYLLNTKEIRDLMGEVLQASRIPEQQKKYIKAIYVDKLPAKKARVLAFGKDIGYQEEAQIGGLLESPAIKEFLQCIQMFYIQIAPIASMREAEVLLDPRTDAETILKAADQIHRKAGIGVEQKTGNQLPVHLTINIPTKTEVNIGKGDTP